MHLLHRKINVGNRLNRPGVQKIYSFGNSLKTGGMLQSMPGRAPPLAFTVHSAFTYPGKQRREQVAGSREGYNGVTGRGWSDDGGNKGDYLVQGCRIRDEFADAARAGQSCQVADGMIFYSEKNHSPGQV